MSAADQMRAMLDQLMGTSRDGCGQRKMRVSRHQMPSITYPIVLSPVTIPHKEDSDNYDMDFLHFLVEAGCSFELVSLTGESKLSVRFTDPKVCKSFLLGCCPNEILASTRMDLGTCAKIHDVALRADYESAIKEKDYFYDIDAMEHLQSFIGDCDRKTELAKRRLAETQDELSAEVAAKANKVHELAEQIGKKLARAEELGADGLVEESMKLMEEVEDIRKQKASAEQEYRNSMPASSYQQQKLRVCEVCSAYLGIHDNDRRLADHFGGKLHLGFIKIRENLNELRKSVDERREARRKAREEELNERRRGGSRDRSRSRERRRRSRSRERSARRRSRSRSRDRDRDRRRYRDRSSERRRDRSRDRDRDRRRRRDSRERDRRPDGERRSASASNGRGDSASRDD